MTSPASIGEPAGKRESFPLSTRWVAALLLAVFVGGVAIGYIAAEYLRTDATNAPDPVNLVSDLSAADVSCAEVFRVDEAGNEREAICLATGGEVVTMSTFADRPEIDQWVAALCRGNERSVTDPYGSLVFTDDTIFTVTGRPLSIEGGGPTPEPEAVAARIAEEVGGTLLPYGC